MNEDIITLLILVNFMATSIKNFYINIIAKTEFFHGKKHIEPLSRMEFSAGSSIAFLFLVQKVALSIFYLMANIVTFFLYNRIRNSFFNNIQDALTYSCVIPLGIIGSLFPQTVNEKILQIPSGGLFC